MAEERLKAQVNEDLDKVEELPSWVGDPSGVGDLPAFMYSIRVDREWVSEWDPDTSKITFHPNVGFFADDVEYVTEVAGMIKRHFIADGQLDVKVAVVGYHRKFIGLLAVEFNGMILDGRTIEEGSTS